MKKLLAIVLFAAGCSETPAPEQSQQFAADLDPIEVVKTFYQAQDKRDLGLMKKVTSDTAWLNQWREHWDTTGEKRSVTAIAKPSLRIDTQYRQAFVDFMISWPEPEEARAIAESPATATLIYEDTSWRLTGVYNGKLIVK